MVEALGATLLPATTAEPSSLAAGADMADAALVALQTGAHCLRFLTHRSELWFIKHQRFKSRADAAHGDGCKCPRVLNLAHRPE